VPFYRKKPVVIEARQYTGENADEIVRWSSASLTRRPGEDQYMEPCENCDATPQDHPNDYCFTWIGEGTAGPLLIISTLEGDHEVGLGDYVIKGIAGEFYPCKPDIFALTYEEVEEENAGT